VGSSHTAINPEQRIMISGARKYPAHGAKLLFSFEEQITDFYDLLTKDMSSLFVLLVWGAQHLSVCL
jgi:hypothetical protein